MTDKELLELAAKALGFVAERHGDGTYDLVTFQGTEEVIQAIWNPLTDDSDALRLAVGLQLDIERDGDSVAVWFNAPRPGWDNGQVGAWIEPTNDDPYAATRRAIVRAAAEIGRSMK